VLQVFERRRLVFWLVTQRSRTALSLASPLLISALRSSVFIGSFGSRGRFGEANNGTAPPRRPLLPASAGIFGISRLQCLRGMALPACPASFCSLFIGLFCTFFFFFFVGGSYGTFRGSYGFAVWCRNKMRYFSASARVRGILARPRGFTADGGSVGAPLP
jgi:hypothetical protein